MTTRFGFSFVLLAPFATLLGCGDVAKCPRGELGCLDGVPDQGECKFDLVVDGVSGLCVRPKDAREPADTPPLCEGWSDDEALRYEEPPATCFPENLEANAGASEEELFDLLCTALCEQDSVHARVYCDNDLALSGCAINANLRQTCTDIALEASGGDDTQSALNTALQNACITTSTTPCTETVCFDANGGSDQPAACGDTDLCSDDCQYANDGACDDGDAVSALTGVCAYGTDCGDCGPRVRDMARRARLGESCVTDYGCRDFDESYDFAKSGAFCDAPNPDEPDAFRCLASCVEDECDDGFTCRDVKFDGAAFKDRNGVTARVCVPATCD